MSMIIRGIIGGLSGFGFGSALLKGIFFPNEDRMHYLIYALLFALILILNFGR